MKEKQDSEILNTRYVLVVKDLSKSVNYYRDLLGFVTWREGDGFHFLNRGKFSVMLGEYPDDLSAFETQNHSYFAYIDVENVDNLYREYLSKGVEDLSDIEIKPWGQREFSVQTIDGHRIMFGQDMLEKKNLRTTN